MIEDASIIYKVSRAPERRIFYIDVGNLPKMKAEQYLKDIMTKYKNKVVFDSQTGQIRDDRRFLSMQEDFWLPRRCLSLNTKIKLLDGRDVELSKLIEEHNEGKQNWTYSVSPDGEIVPGKISWAGITRKDTEVVKITIDNGEEIITTPDHKFILRDGSLCEAQNLKEFDSLMPLYTRRKPLSGKYSGEYDQIFNNKSNRWNFSHRTISNYIYGEKANNEVIHHIDFNRYNNNPENLQLMDKLDHYTLHSTYGTNSWNNGNREEHCKNLSIAGKLFFTTEAGNSRKLEISKFNKSDDRIQNALIKGREIAKELRAIDKLNLSKEEYYAKWVNIEQFHIYNESVKLKKDTYDFQIICSIIDENFHSKITAKELLVKINEIYPKFCISTFNRYFKLNGYRNLFTYLKDTYQDKYKRGTTQSYYNHKVLKVEFLENKIDTGTLTIDENHEYHNYHNFALSCGIFVKNSDSRGTEITTLPSSAAFDDMSMVEYFEKKLYKSLSVPYSRLVNPDSPFDQGNPDQISRDEIKFAKFINRLRLKFSDLFDQALKTQCYLKGICTQEEFDDYKQHIYYNFKLNNHYAELIENQLLQGRLTLLSEVDPYVGKYFSQSWVQRTILQMKDEEIKEMYQEIQDEIAEGLYPDPKTLLEPPVDQQTLDQPDNIDQTQDKPDQVDSTEQDATVDNKEPDKKVKKPTNSNKQKNPYYDG